MPSFIGCLGSASDHGRIIGRVARSVIRDGTVTYDVHTLVHQPEFGAGIAIVIG